MTLYCCIIHTSFSQMTEIWLLVCDQNKYAVYRVSLFALRDLTFYSLHLLPVTETFWFSPMIFSGLGATCGSLINKLPVALLSVVAHCGTHSMFQESGQGHCSVRLL